MNSVTSCSVKDPINDIEWLSDKIKEIQGDDLNSQYYYVFQARYLGESVFVIGNCCETCRSSFDVFNCTGELIGDYVKSSEDFDNSKVFPVMNLWTPDNSVCEISN